METYFHEAHYLVISLVKALLKIWSTLLYIYIISKYHLLTFGCDTIFIAFPLSVFPAFKNIYVKTPKIEVEMRK